MTPWTTSTMSSTVSGATIADCAFFRATTSAESVATTSSHTGAACKRVTQMLSRLLRVEIVEPEWGPAPVVSTPKTTMIAVRPRMIQPNVGSGAGALVPSRTPVS